MSTTTALSSVVLCQYKTGELGPYTVVESNTRVVGKVHWTYKDKKISFYFKATARESGSHYNSKKGYVWNGNQAGNVRIGANGTWSAFRFFVRQTSYDTLTGIVDDDGWTTNPGTYDQTFTVTIGATTSSIPVRVELSSSNTASTGGNFTPSTNNIVTTQPYIEYYRDGPTVYARVRCDTTHSNSSYSDSYAYRATLTVSGQSTYVDLSMPTSSGTNSNTSNWLAVQSTANSLTATLSIASTNGGAYGGTQSTTLSVPAMTTISGAASGTLGTDYTINMTRYDASFTDTLTYLINGTTIGTIASDVTGSTSSYTWSAPPLSLASYATSATSITVTIRCTTASGATTIGSTDLSVTFAMPDSIRPTLGTIALTKVNSNTTVAGWDIYLQGYTKCQIDITGSSGIYGSSISSYTVKVGDVTVNGTGSSSNENWTGTSDTISVSGSITVSISCVDSRGRTASTTQTITVYQYSYPTATSTLCHRTDSASSSAESDDGTYIYMYAVANYSTANNNNSVSMTIKWRQTGTGSYDPAQTVASGVGASYGGGNISVASAYDVVLTVIDTLGNGNTYTFSLPTGVASMHIKEGGTGICFGGYSTHDNSVEIASDMQMIMGDGVIRTTLPNSGVAGQIVLLVSGGSLIPYVYDGTSWISTLLSSYPVGSIYMSTSSTSPATLFGGTWTQLEDCFLLTAGQTYTAGDTGGAASHTHETQNHTLTTNEMPSHTHIGRIGYMESGYGMNIPTWSAYLDGSGTGPWGASGNNSIKGTNGSTTYSDKNSRRLVDTEGAGGGAAHNHGDTGSSSNMPPYYVVYAWERTA